LGTRATVATTVQELINADPGSVNNDREEASIEPGELPLVVSADLTSTDLNGMLVSLGQGFSVFADPARLDQANPEEFALEAACYSDSESVSYSVTSRAVEDRTVLFARAGNQSAPPEIAFPLSGVRTVESRIFLSGAVVCWSKTPGKSLIDLLADLQITVTRGSAETPLFRTTLVLNGTEDGTVAPTRTGPIRFEIVDLAELESLGVDADSMAVLRRVAEDGTLVVVVVPPQEHAYRYSVRADERFVLTATLEARIRNAPGGTGVAAVLGRPFEDLADFIDLGLPGVEGVALERSINAAASARTLGLVSEAPPPRASAGGGMCGAFGMEATVMLSLGLFLTLGRSAPRCAGRRDRSEKH